MVTVVSISYGMLSSSSVPYHYANGATTIKDNNKDLLLIEGISTLPKVLHVDDSFTLVVTVKNSSPHTIFFPVSKCLGKPVSLDFISNNVRKLVKICNGAPLLASMNSGEMSVVNSAMYKAVAAGSTQVIATIFYGTSSNGPFNISVSKVFSFPIFDRNTLVR